MAIIKCKMCGGNLVEEPGVTVAECEYCGTQQTIPKTNDEVISNLFNRANNLRLKCEFDKAAQIYEKIVQQDDGEAEAHWGIVLCKYGIEYVEDPKTFKRIPTCHRTLFEAVTTDVDYLAAIDYSDALQQRIYEREARAIDRIQKDILAIVKNEKPFDVFICYKESDENSKRTVDSVLANDIYHQLTQEGMKVFYAAITLEDKLGQEYEPYIFAALNSAKVMLVIGTKPEYFSAVWVKNEWSRFLKLMKTDRSKLLIPCYRDMDAYDLPEEFAHLQAQDMSKIGFINDVVRGIKKLAQAETPKQAVSQETAANVNTAPLLKRAFMFLEDKDWHNADEYCEKVLDLDPENARAYLGKLMAELRVSNQESLQHAKEPFDGRNNYRKVIRFGDDALRSAMKEYIEHINVRNAQERLEKIYIHAKQKMDSAITEEEFHNAVYEFESIPNYKDSSILIREGYEKAESARKDAILLNGKKRMENDTVSSCQVAIKLFSSVPGWKDAENCIELCKRRIKELEVQAQREQEEREAQARREQEEREAQAQREQEEQERKRKQLEVEAEQRKARIIQSVNDKCGIPELTRKIKSLSASICTGRETVQQINKELESLKFYQIGEKSRLTKQLQSLEAEIIAKESQLSTARNDLETAQKKAKETAEKICENASKWHEMAIRYYYHDWKHFTRDLLPVLESMERRGEATVLEILQDHPRKDLSNIEVTSFFREEGFKHFYKREMFKGKAYFSICLNE